MIKIERGPGEKTGLIVLLCVLLAGGLFIVLVKTLAPVGVQAHIRSTYTTQVLEASTTLIRIKNLVVEYHRKECKFPQNAVSSILPLEEATVAPDFSEHGWKDIGMKSSRRMYFRYRMINEGTTLKIIADADFFPNIPEEHRVTMVMTQEPNCLVKFTPPKTTNEFK